MNNGRRWTKRVTALALAALVAIASVGAGCAKSGDAARGTESPGTATLRIGYLPLTHSAPLMLADAATGGDLGEAKLELVRFSSWPELTEALNTGSIDGAVTMLELALAAAEKGIDSRVVALSHRGGDALVAGKGIASVADLKGERFGIPHRLSGHNILLKTALEREGMKLDDVERIEMAPADMPAALARGEIAGYVVAEPFGAKSVAEGFGTTLVTAEELWPDWPCCALALRPAAVADQSEAVQSLVDAFVAAGASIETDPNAAADKAARYTNYDAKLWKRSLELGIRYDDLTPRPDEIARIADELAEMGLLKGTVDTDKLVDASFAQRASAQPSTE